MLSNEGRKVKDFLSSIKQANNGQQRKTVEEKREYYNKGMLMTTAAPDTAIIDKVNIAGMNAEWVRAENVKKDKRVVLYFHGGGFYAGSCLTHRGLAYGISKSGGVQVLLIEYRLAPEHKYPAANNDCMDAYIWLLNNGFEAKNIILGGESSGATLALMTLLTLKGRPEPMPCGAFLLSIYGDMLYYDGDSYITRAEVDVISSSEATAEDREYYIPASFNDVELCPIKQDLQGLPELYIQAADHEIVLSDSLRLADNAKAAGVDVTLQVWDEMWHCFQAFWGMVSESRQAVNNIGDFIKRKLNA